MSGYGYGTEYNVAHTTTGKTHWWRHGDRAACGRRILALDNIWLTIANARAVVDCQRCAASLADADADADTEARR